MIGKSRLLSPKLLCTGLIAVMSICVETQAKTFSFDEYELNLGARPRFGYVDAPTDAKTASILLRLRAESEWTERFSTVVELDYVQLALEDEFTNGVNFNNTPVIPDVEGFDINQFYLQFAISNTTDLVVGREVINLGNERFVGSNSFWQNEQSADAIGFNYEFATSSRLMYRYVDNVNRINGDDAGTFLHPSDPIFEANNGRRPPNFLGDHSHKTHLLFAEIKETDHSVFQAYYFDMDIEEARLLSNQTFGARYEYKARWGRLKTFAHAELAFQKRPELSNDGRYRYLNMGLGLGYKTRDFILQYEVLGEDNGSSFVTPLASLHDQNGWADKFLATPRGGLRDLSGKLIWRFSPFKLDLRYHIFSSDVSGDDIGKELDIDLSYKFSQNNSILLRFADFRSDSAAFQSEKRLFLQYFYNL